MFTRNSIVSKNALTTGKSTNLLLVGLKFVEKTTLSMNAVLIQMII